MISRIFCNLFHWQIFCTHGGIPRPCHGGGLLSAIREAPIVLSDPEIQCPLVWELMWSDPIRYVCHVQYVHMLYLDM